MPACRLIAILWLTLAQSAPVAASVAATAVTPDDALVQQSLADYLTQAEQQRSNGDPAQAASAFALAYTLQPTPAILLRLAAAYAQAGQPQEALFSYERCLQDAAADSATHAAAAAALTTLRSEPAATADDLARLARAYRDRAHAQFQQAHYEPAAALYAAAYALGRHPKVLFNIGQALRRAGRAREALSLYTRFLAADPSTPLRSETVGYLVDMRAILASARPNPPLYRRGWLWAVVGAAAGLLATSIALGVILTQNEPVPIVGTYRVMPLPSTP